MQITKIEAHGFKGQNFTMTPSKVNVLLGENGTGKSSLLEAIRYALTGELPSKEITNCSVEITLANGDVFSREKTTKTTCAVNGRKVTAEALNAYIADAIECETKNIKLQSSTEILTELSSDNLLNLLMGFIPEDLDTDTVLAYFGDISEDVKDEIVSSFPPMPEKFGIDKVNEIKEMFANQKKEVAGFLKTKNTMIKANHSTKPTRTEAEVDSEITSITVIEKNKKLYDAALKKNEEKQAKIKALRAKVPTYAVKAPDEAEMKRINTKITEYIEKRAQKKSMLDTTAKNISMFENTLNNLGKAVCPISEKLVCTTDKTSAKTELEIQINQNKSMLDVINKDINILNSEIDSLTKSLRSMEAAKKLLAERESILAQIKAYEDTDIPIPALPDFDGDPTAAINLLKKEKEEIRAWNEKEKLTADVEYLNSRLAICKSIDDALADKGIVKTKIMDYYLNDITNICNESINGVLKGFLVQFCAEDGVKILVKTPTSEEYKPISVISSGERIVTTIIISNLLNQLSAIKMLFIDNVEALDEKTLKDLRALLSTEEFLQEYDNIFVCGVNHDSVSNALAGMTDTAYL